MPTQLFRKAAALIAVTALCLTACGTSDMSEDTAEDTAVSTSEVPQTVVTSTTVVELTEEQILQLAKQRAKRQAEQEVTDELIETYRVSVETIYDQQDPLGCAAKNLFTYAEEVTPKEVAVTESLLQLANDTNGNFFMLLEPTLVDAAVEAAVTDCPEIFNTFASNNNGFIRRLATAWSNSDQFIHCIYAEIPKSSVIARALISGSENSPGLPQTMASTLGPLCGQRTDSLHVTEAFELQVQTCALEGVIALVTTRSDLPGFFYGKTMEELSALTELTIPTGTAREFFTSLKRSCAVDKFGYTVESVDGHDQLIPVERLGKFEDGTTRNVPPTPYRILFDLS